MSLSVAFQIVAVTLASMSDAPPRSMADTITVRRVGGIMGPYYSLTSNFGFGVLSAYDFATRDQLECLADEGRRCFGGDPTFHHCMPDVRCGMTAQPELLLEPLLTAARANSEAGFVAGQAIYALVKYGWLDEAGEVASDCRAEGWWCGLLEGHVLHARGDLEAADASFRHALATAPEPVRCGYADGTWLLGKWMQQTEMTAGSPEWRRMQARSCLERAEWSERIWWLSDPLYAVPANDRWAEHINRNLQWELDGHLRRAVRINMLVWAESVRTGWWRSFMVRRGHRDSWSWDGRRERHGLGYTIAFTGRNAARYHFVPDFEDGDLARPSWRLYAELDDEGYTPPYGAFHELPTQIARFRSPHTPGDSMRVAAAATVVGTDLVAARDPEPHLILTDAPESFPVRVTGDFDEHRTSTFLVASAAERYVLSYEVLSDGRYGWHRQMLEPLEGTGAGISDVLLYRPDDPAPPEALEPAAALMLGEPAVARGAELGVFWEAYGAPAGTEVTVELEIEGGGGGFFSRLRSLLPGGGSAPVRLSWSEPSPGEVFPRGVSLGTEGLEPGSYKLVVRIAWEGQDALVSTRSLEIR